MARNDGKDYSVARNGKYTRSKIGNIERHNERKNETYQNTDVQLERSHLNIYFKKPTDTYLGMFDSMDEVSAKVEEIIFTELAKADCHPLTDV